MYICESVSNTKARMNSFLRVIFPFFPKTFDTHMYTLYANLTRLKYFNHKKDWTVTIHMMEKIHVKQHA